MNDTTAPALPTIHRNGTGRDSLIDDYSAAAQAVRLAIARVQEASPNARDYYPQGPHATAQADREHASRLARLLTVQDELYAILEHITDHA